MKCEYVRCHGSADALCRWECMYCGNSVLLALNEEAPVEECSRGVLSLPRKDLVGSADGRKPFTPRQRNRKKKEASV